MADASRAGGRPLEAYPPDRSAGDEARRLHWIVTTHHRMRTLSFANSFAFSAVHIWTQSYPAWIWLSLVLVFLVYPQLAYWRARSAGDAQRAELQNLVLDCFLVAIPIAGIGFPLWITFTLFIATTINNAMARGRRGTWEAISAFLAGSLLGSAAAGFHVAPDHGGLVTALCIFGLCWYLLGISHVAYKRAMLLREAREDMKQGELALQQANDSLLTRLEEIHGLQERLREQANRDPLTGLFNRRYLQETMDRELARCQREQTPLSVILIDIDRFKRINDRHGHQAGDEVIKQLAGLLASEARQEDVACRYGGEEFLLLMPKMPLVAARERAERWRRRFASMAVRAGSQDVTATLSAGIAEFPTHGRSGAELTRCADLALYQAKSAGRDQVVTYAPVPA
ncbi:MAG TPA: diguanylate cyclase [Vicinamibacteria bacterium]|jgi:diguanylate cyclase (GGDEF)-like protein